MKFFSALVGFLAFMCSTTLAQKFSIRDIILSLPLADIERDIIKYSSNIQCHKNVLDKILSKHQVNDLWEYTKTETTSLVNVDMKKCMEIKDPEEHMK